MVHILSPMMRSAIYPITLILGFSFLLVSYNLLSQPISPSRKQHLGWQAWDVVQYPLAATSSASTDLATGGSSNGSTSQDEDLDDGSSGSFAPSLPLDTWDPLLPHTTGLTEITVASCYFPPWLYPSMCSPKTTGEEDKLKGKWVRVERDLNWKSGLWYLNVYYRRTRRFDVPLITDIVFLEEGASPPGSVNLTEYHQAAGNFRDGVWPTQKAMRLWYKTTKTTRIPGSTTTHLKRREEAGKRNDWDYEDEVSSEQEENWAEEGGWAEDEEIVTELDILYGDGPELWGFQRVWNGPLNRGIKDRWETVDLLMRKGNPIATPAPSPRFHPSGKFKIMQIADLHFSVGTGTCRDTDKPNCVGDPDSIALFSEAIDKINPDLIVFTGDMLNGQGSSYDSRSVIAKYTKPVIDRQIPWAGIFGNHDSEIMDDRAFQMKLMQYLPYSLSEPGPSDVDGVGNYYLKLHSADASFMHLFTLYFLDSHARQQRKLPWVEPDYDYLKPSQIQWYLNASAEMKPIIRPFTPDGASDLGKVWKRSEGGVRLRKEESDKILAKPNAMMFFHIPIDQSYGPVDEDPATGEALDLGNQYPQDGPGGSKTDSGLFENGLVQAKEISDEDYEEVEAQGGSVPRRTEVKVIGHGHCHNTDKCRRVKGIWSCFGGGSSYSGYGHLEFDRRFRVYELLDYGETVKTYKITDEWEKIDEEVLVGKGAPAGVGLQA